MQSTKLRTGKRNTQNVTFARWKNPQCMLPLHGQIKCENMNDKGRNGCRNGRKCGTFHEKIAEELSQAFEEMKGLEEGI